MSKLLIVVLLLAGCRSSSEAESPRDELKAQMRATAQATIQANQAKRAAREEERAQGKAKPKLEQASPLDANEVPAYALGRKYGYHEAFLDLAKLSRATADKPNAAARREHERGTLYAKMLGIPLPTGTDQATVIYRSIEAKTSRRTADAFMLGYQLVVQWTLSQNGSKMERVAFLARLAKELALPRELRAAVDAAVANPTTKALGDLGATLDRYYAAD